MAMVRTETSKVARLAGSKGVGIEEPFEGREGKTYTQRFTVWLGEGHGLQVGDSARFLGRLVVKVKPNQPNGKTYVDLEISDASVVEGSLVKAPDPRGSWEVAEPGAAWAGE